ncbi:MAG: AzlC family ABC transporter permease [Pseudomonadota bacterium]
MDRSTDTPAAGAHAGAPGAHAPPQPAPPHAIAPGAPAPHAVAPGERSPHAVAPGARAPHTVVPGERPPHAPTRRGFVAGLVACLPVLLAVAPFGMIFGTLAVEAGFDLVQTMAYTVIVVAGASQLAAMQVLTDGAPVLLAVFTGAIVNLRMAMYSASIAVALPGVPLSWRIPAAFFLHDQAFALSMQRYAARPDEPLGDKLGFYFGVGITTAVVWVIATLVGALLGAQIPESWGIEFAVPATFLAAAAPMIRGTANVVAAGVAVVAAILFVHLPAGFGLLVATALGIAAGMATRRLLPPAAAKPVGPSAGETP